MTPLNDIFQRVRAIPWFRHVGERADIPSLPYRYNQLVSWKAAREHYSSAAWQDTTLEARNALTEFLCIRHPSRYRLWNNITTATRDGFLISLLQEQVTPYRRAHDLDATFFQCVSWDLLGALMEFAYGDIPKRPTFFLHLLTVYEAGHFPCGWSGTWPDGQLLLY